ncbi:protein kinase domain-containing protein [Pseudonocardia sp. CA-107938]|uniref:serine/threonine-protein kinase n=1 Tax=Pseudonocardia sp. CA-107938 TaxID=3240021 RepID=UPI003D919BB4
MTVLAAGQKIAGRYLLERRIAVGGMGEVWEASDTRLGRSVAVKVLRPELSDDPEFLHRFRIEARTVASLDNPGIAAVHDYGEDEGPNGKPTAYLVMELVRGEPLSTLIARGPIPADETLRIVEEAAWALQAAHERGFVHRDVKPGNILVRTDGTIKLTDFGIAKAADAVPVTRSGMVMGTAHYIAPEQASGAEAGPAGDVYSLGIVGYECLAGHRPFRADSAVAVAMMQVRNEPPPLPTSVPRAARELIESVLVKDPTQRYSSGGEFASAVAAVRRGEAMPLPGATPGAVYTPVRGGRVVSLDSGPFPQTGAHTGIPGGAQTGTQAGAPPRTASRPVPKAPPRTPPPRTPPPASGPYPAPDRNPSPAPGTPAPRRRATRHAEEPVAPRTPPPRTPDRRPISPARGQEPLALRPKRGIARKLVVMLFVLLTLAALIVGAFVVRRMQGGTENPSIGGASGLARQDDATVRRAALAVPADPVHHGGGR